MRRTSDCGDCEACPDVDVCEDRDYGAEVCPGPVCPDLWDLLLGDWKEPEEQPPAQERTQPSRAWYVATWKERHQ